jgi:hypothetical protein
VPRLCHLTGPAVHARVQPSRRTLVSGNSVFTPYLMAVNPLPYLPTQSCAEWRKPESAMWRTAREDREPEPGDC